METTWWRELKQLDGKQKEFIALPTAGRYSLIGPPGSGKTNLLLLRAQYVAGAGYKNVLVITYTNDLADFIRTGISKKGIIGGDQIQTFHAWALRHIRSSPGATPIDLSEGWDEAMRLKVVEALVEARGKLPSTKLYDAIFVDEAQDLSVDELRELLALSENVTVCGDRRQSIYQMNGLDISAVLGLTPHALTTHYRIGPRIAQVADRLIPPAVGAQGLEDASNYNEVEMGDATADMHDCVDRDQQFGEMSKRIDVQLDAFKGNLIGVLVGKADTVKELSARFAASPFSKLVTVHDGDKGGDGFSSGKPIHVMTIHRAKGAEFRAVHMYGAEELKTFGLNHRELGYTAVTRAKTSLNAYKSGRSNRPLESAFAKEQHVALKDLFDGDTSE